MKASGSAFRNERGMTLLEVIAALVISALVIALASRLFLTGQSQFLERVFESDRLSGQVRLKGALRQALEGEVLGCESGALRLKGEEKDLAASIKERFPGADSLEFHCRETSQDGESLVKWAQRFQPQLVEYRLVLLTRGKKDRLEGSILK